MHTLIAFVALLVALAVGAWLPPWAMLGLWLLLAGSGLTLYHRGTARADRVRRGG